jgi:DNA-binding protein Fis
MLELPERRFLERALAAVGGSRVRAAELLGINRSTLFNKLRKHGLQPPGAGSAERRPAA